MGLPRLGTRALDSEDCVCPSTYPTAVSLTPHACPVDSHAPRFPRHLRRALFPPGSHNASLSVLPQVPSVYTLHTRVLVNSPTQHTWQTAGLIFLVGTVGGVLLNFWADSQRMWFREADGNIDIWGKRAVAVRCKYVVLSFFHSACVRACARAHVCMCACCMVECLFHTTSTKLCWLCHAEYALNWCALCMCACGRHDASTHAYIHSM